MTSNFGKFRPDGGSQAERWRLPTMAANSGEVFREEVDIPAATGEDETSAIPTADEIEQWHQQAREEGQRQGYQEGLAQARHEIEDKAAQLQRLIDFFDRPLLALNDEVEQQLSVMVVALAQQLVRREIKAEPGEIIGLIREAVQLLPASSRHIRIHLHPEDAELVRTTLQLDENDEEKSWKLVEDPMISRGGCEIKSDKSVINATLENRLQALAASILGGERSEDQGR